MPSPNAPAPIGPYSQATEFNGLVFISGQIAIDQSTGKVVNSTIEEETKQVMTNIGHILEQAGLNYSNILKSTIFIRDMSQFAQINAMYGAYFIENPPARETVEVSRLPKDVGVEISCIAHR